MKLQFYILRELVLTFAFAVGGMLVLALPAVAVAAVSKLPGVATLDVLRFLPLLLSGLAPYVLPLGFLLAVVVTYGRLSADNEWTSIRMAGWNPWWMLAPAAVLAGGLGTFNYWLASEKLPQVRREQGTFATRALRGALTNIPPGRTELSFGRFYLSAEGRDGDDFLSAFIYLPGSDGREPKRLLAQRVHFQFQGTKMLVYLTRARIVVGAADFQNEHPVFQLDLDELARDSGRSYNTLRYRTSPELLREIASGNVPPSQRHMLEYEINSRRAISSTYLMFLLLGAPTGLLLRRGTQLGALSVAVGYALVYYVFSMRLGKELAASSVIPAALGAWMVVIAGALCGALLSWKALRQ